MAHGKKAKIWIADPSDPTVLVERTTMLHSARQAFQRDLAEDSRFGQTGKTFEAGMNEASFTADVRGDDEIDELLFNCYNSDAKVKIRYAPEGNDSGARYFDAMFLLGNYEPGSSTGDVNGGSTSFTRSGDSTRSTFA